MSRPAIDVIMRAGGRPGAVVERAVRSLAGQSAGAVRLLLVRHGSADLAAVRGWMGGALQGLEVIEAPAGNRGAAMAAGLARVAAPRFAFLDDDDYLLPDHFRRLLKAAESIEGPSFAYCDILAEDEGAPPGERMRLFREGPAKPPLGRITDRISVHAFLADRAALQSLPFDRWTLSTAEDALLVASLLARSTPVHAPYATCVYVQGRGDASDYLAHPDRAADELTFAREIAPLRAAVEAKFGVPEDMDEAVYLAPFIAAARHAALFAELRRRPATSEATAVRDGARAVAIADDPTLTTLEIGSVFEPVAGQVQAGADGTVRIDAAQDYVYAARAPIDLVAEARPVVIAVPIARVDGAFGVALADGGQALVCEARMEPVPGALELQLPWDRLEPPLLVVRRLNALGAAEPHIRIGPATAAFPNAGLVQGGDRLQARTTLAAAAAAPRERVSPSLAATPRGEGASVLDEPVEVDLGDAPWAYAFSTPLLPALSRAAVRVDLGPTRSPVFVLRVDDAWAAVGERVEAPAGVRPTRVWLEPLVDGAASRLVIQAGPAPNGGRVTVEGLVLYPRAAASGTAA